MTRRMDLETDGAMDRSEAFRILADENLDDAYRLAYAVLRDTAETRDAVHDAFVTAWDGWASLRDPSKFDAWFRQIVVNTCRNRLSAASRRRMSDAALQTELPAPDSTESVHERELVVSALSKLKPDDRIVLALRYYRDLKVEDIAEVLGIPSGTATSRLRKAHQRLRSVLETAEPKEDRHG
jgi:RNA polymerase sigma-70 factor (ECF subfamily)